MATTPAQQILENIKFAGLVDIITNRRGNLAISRGMLNAYHEFTGDERNTLSQFGEKLARYLTHDRNPNASYPDMCTRDQIAAFRSDPPPVDLLDIACLHGPFSRRMAEKLDRSPLMLLANNSRSFRPEKLESGAGWIVWALRTLEAARQLSPTQQQKILHATLPDDPVEALTLICRALREPPHIPSTEEVVRNLDSAQGQELGRLALNLLKQGGPSEQEIAGTLLEQLACEVPGALIGLHVELAEFPPLYRPGVIFYNAPDPVSQPLLKHTENADGFLKAMAWCRDPGAVAYFKQMRDSNQTFPQLHIKPHKYAAVGGWELTDEGTRRDLVYDRAFQLIRPDDDAPDRKHSPVKIAVARKQKCPLCYKPLTDLLQINLTDDRFSFLGLSGSRLTVPTCTTCFDWTYARMDPDDDVIVLPQSSRHEYMTGDEEFDRWPADALTLGPEARTPVEALARHGSYIGGHADWIDDAFYPPCPDCNRAMMLLAHISLYELKGDGTVFAWVCPTCRITATNFRCT